MNFPIKAKSIMIPANTTKVVIRLRRLSPNFGRLTSMSSVWLRRLRLRQAQSGLQAQLNFDRLSQTEPVETWTEPVEVKSHYLS